jgi:hypothetical protein
LIAKARRELRSEPALHSERRGIPTREQRREVAPPEDEHRRRARGSHAHRVLATVEQPDLADDLAGTRRPDLHDAITGHVKRDREVPIDDEEELPRPISLAPEDLALSHRSAAEQSRKLLQARFVLAFEERDGAEEVGGLAVRHRDRASRSRPRSL